MSWFKRKVEEEKVEETTKFLSLKFKDNFYKIKKEIIYFDSMVDENKYYDNDDYIADILSFDEFAIALYKK